MEQFIRTRMMIGSGALQRLQKARVAVFGVGGVGGACCEALVRSGVMAIDLFDNDVVSVSNINRQLIALHSTIGRAKTEVMAERLKDISPECAINVHRMFYLPETADEVDLSQYDYVVDAIDTVAAKLELISRCQALKVPIITALGAGNKLDPSQLQVTDIYKTTICPLARVMRTGCRKRGIEKLKVVYSTEQPVRCEKSEESEAEKEQLPKKAGRRDTPGSMMFVPAAMGLMIAGQVVEDLIGNTQQEEYDI